MISWLSGVVLEKAAPSLVLNVNGVGYEVFVPMSSFVSLPAIGQDAAVFIHMVVREDAQLLYGFMSKQERELFQILLKVNGVGAKMALNILSAMDAHEFAQKVHDKDVSALVKLPGIGKKTAERLVIELLDRLQHWQLDDGVSAPAGASADAGAFTAQDDALAALIALGYKEADAQKAIKSVVDSGSYGSSEALIREALRSHVR
ncbi:MAG: Holliday junction branch migration protein RuvA [Pseudomonadota bacterium]